LASEPVNEIGAPKRIEPSKPPAVAPPAWAAGLVAATACGHAPVGGARREPGPRDFVVGQRDPGVKFSF